MQHTPSHPAPTRLAILCFSAVIAGAWVLCSASSQAEAAPVPSKHQMMKDCMAKQKASEAGRTREDMKNSCKDVIETEKQNADKASAAPPSTPAKQ
jgi:hypothetical protein